MCSVVSGSQNIQKTYTDTRRQRQLPRRPPHRNSYVYARVTAMGAGHRRVEHPAATYMRLFPSEPLGHTGLRSRAHHRSASGKGSRTTTAVSADRRAA